MRHEAKNQESLSNQEPFVIRAHHLGRFRNLIQHKNNGGWLYANDPIYSPEEETGKILSAIRNAHEKGYAEDVLGTSLESADRFAEQAIRTFRRFLSLPDDYPAEIVEGIKDDICKGCAAGEHCKSLSIVYGKSKKPNLVRKIKDYFSDYESKNDSNCSDLFIKVMKNVLYSPNKPLITKIKVRFSDSGKPEKMRVIKTTIGTVKNALAQSQIIFP